MSEVDCNDPRVKAAQEMLSELTIAAEPLMRLFVATLNSIQPPPNPLVTAVAARYLELYAAHAMVRAAAGDQPELEAIQQTFDVLDGLTSVRRLVDGMVEFRTTDTTGFTVVAPLSDDPSLFDMDSWEGSDGE